MVSAGGTMVSAEGTMVSAGGTMVSAEGTMVSAEEPLFCQGNSILIEKKPQIGKALPRLEPIR